jgi:hypothetical protein
MSPPGDPRQRGRPWKHRKRRPVRSAESEAMFQNASALSGQPAPMASGMHLFGLLHTSAGESNTANAKIDEAQIPELLVRNAITLWRSLARAGVAFTLICSDPDRIRALATRLRASGLDVAAIPFALDVPSGIPFYSAHHKLDVFRHLASLPESSYVGLVDLDVIALGALPPSLARVIDRGTPLAYDITEQVVPALGREALAGDLATLTGMPSAGRWLGGEFLAGRPPFFRALSAEIDWIYRTLVREWRGLRRQGMETPTTAAVEQLRNRGVEVVDAGELGIIRRYWSIPPRHPQPSFDEISLPFLLHLPADKKLLAGLSTDTQLDTPRFLAAYRRHLRRRSAPNLARRMLKPLLANR